MPEGVRLPASDLAILLTNVPTGVNAPDKLLATLLVSVPEGVRLPVNAVSYTHLDVYKRQPHGYTNPVSNLL